MHEQALLSSAALRRRLQPAATLREVRVAACLTHEQVATRAGVHLRTVRNAEQGRRVPTLATRAKLAAALGVDPAAIAWSATTHQEADR